jgi:methionyl-tRNA formyltransferase
MIDRAATLRVAFFGRSNVELSVAGLAHLLTYPELEIISVTCGRGAAEQKVDGRLQRLAREHGLPVMPFAQVRETHPQLDLVVSFSNPVVFPRDFLALVTFGCVNLHPAPLPEYRGCHSIEHALLNGDTTFAATLHFCDAGIDTGPIIAARRVRIDADDVASDIWRRVDEAAVKLLADQMPRVIAAAARGERVPAEPQDEARARYYADDSIVGGEIDLAWPYEKIVRFTRAMTHPMRGLAYFVAAGRRVSLRYERGALVVNSIE